jgi:glycosyltransferase involved in cell wall biosynthesis
MKVLMLGWEYPPHISGGLGTACEGLTKALAHSGVEINFVLPHKTGDEKAPHMDLQIPEEFFEQGQMRIQRRHVAKIEFANINKNEIGLGFTSTIEASTAPVLAYSRPKQIFLDSLTDTSLRSFGTAKFFREQEFLVRTIMQSADYCTEDSIFADVERFTKRVENSVFIQNFDVVHAHDWLTFPAGIVAARLARVPLVAHVHSLEIDRSGKNINPLISAIEELGVRVADRIVTVSEYTRDQIVKSFGIEKSRITVAHNGVDPTPPGISSKVVFEDDRPRILFLGRVTFQKGPDYFIEAAALVARQIPEPIFIMAGNGDMLHWARQRVAELGLNDRFEFPGFVRGEELDEQFRRAHAFVMPSVSEPFGIVALEAIHRGTPAIVSRQSGVSEVLRHVFKVDFWDTWRMADLIISILQYPELGSSLRTNAEKEISHLGWDATADRIGTIYSELVNRQPVIM